MIRLALVEDDAACRKELRQYIERYEQESGERFSVREFTDGDEIAVDYRPDYDVILMDIEMRFMNGMMAAEEIRKVDSEVVIVFITNSTQYAIKGYAVNALDYVLKPVAYYAFSQRLARAIERVGRHGRHYIRINTREGIRKLDVSSIYSIESYSHDLSFHTKDGDIVATATMRDMEEQLAPHGFYRCGKSYLVNLEYVDKVDGEEILVAGTRVQLSRARRKGFLGALNDYINGEEG